MDSRHSKRDHHGSRHTDTVSRSNKVMKQRERTMNIINEIIVAWDQQILLLMFHKQCGRQRTLDIVYEIIMSGGIQTLLLIFLKQWGTQSGLDVTNEIISVGGKQILFFIVLKQWVRVGLDSITVIVRAMGGCGGEGRNTHTATYSSKTLRQTVDYGYYKWDIKTGGKQILFFILLKQWSRQSGIWTT